MHTNVKIAPQILNKKDLIDLPVIVNVQGAFNEEMVSKFTESMEKAVNTDQPVVPVVIDSYGGQVYSLLAMIDIIKNCPKTVVTIVSGKAMSCGAILLGFGAEGYRFASPTSTIMIHEVSDRFWGKNVDIQNEAKEIERLNKLLFHMLDQNTGNKKGFWYNLVQNNGHSDLFLTASQAKKHKLATQIGVPYIETRVEVTRSIKL